MDLEYKLITKSNEINFDEVHLGMLPASPKELHLVRRNETIKGHFNNIYQIGLGAMEGILQTGVGVFASVTYQSLAERDFLEAAAVLTLSGVALSISNMCSKKSIEEFEFSLNGADESTENQERIIMNSYINKKNFGIINVLQGALLGPANGLLSTFYGVTSGISSNFLELFKEERKDFENSQLRYNNIMKAIGENPKPVIENTLNLSGYDKTEIETINILKKRVFSSYKESNLESHETFDLKQRFNEIVASYSPSNQTI